MTANAAATRARRRRGERWDTNLGLIVGSCRSEQGSLERRESFVDVCTHFFGFTAQNIPNIPQGLRFRVEISGAITIVHTVRRHRITSTGGLRISPVRDCLEVFTHRVDVMLVPKVAS